METIYCISGLGADRTAFQKLDFPENYTILHLEWLTPLDDESLENYSKRFSTKITNNSPIIIGLSFGGIIAQFVNKYIYCKKVILISSTTSSDSIPIIRKFLRLLPLHKLLPNFLLTKTNFLVFYLFGIKSLFGKSMLKQIFKNADLVFVKWAIQKIIDIESMPKINCQVFQIHGTNDKLFPINLQNPEFTIKNGGHFMVYENAEEVSKLLRSILEMSN
jgi:pimeloyl-ACP methyl ester carboxylesterase